MIIFYCGIVNLPFLLKKESINQHFQNQQWNTRASYETYSELRIKTPERRYLRRFVVFIVSFEQISLPVLVFQF